MLGIDMAESQNFDLLIHITAPGLASDDRRFRNFASAYLDFRPVSRTDVVKRLHEKNHLRSDSPHSSIGDLVTSTEAPTAPPDNIDRHRSVSAEKAANLTQLSWVAPLSMVEDSLPNNDITIPMFNSPTRILENFLAGMESQTQTQTQTQIQIQTQSQNTMPHEQEVSSLIPTNGATGETQTATFASQILSDSTPASPCEAKAKGQEVGCSVPVSQSASHLEHTPQIEIPSSLPSMQPTTSPAPATEPATSSPSPEPIASECIPDSFLASGTSPANFASTQSHQPLAAAAVLLRREPGPLPPRQKSTANPGMYCNSGTGANTKDCLPLLRAESAPPAPKRLKTSPAPSTGAEESEKGGAALYRAESDLIPSPPAKFSSKIAPTSIVPHADVPTMALLQISSPVPSVSLAVLSPPDLIAEGLAKLARDLNMAKRYRPKEVRRPLRPFERGFWKLECGGWDSGLKKDAWRFLRNYVTGGRAGWGLRCCRDEGFNWLRVYCWGYVVGHIYLLLYMATKREVLVSGCEWVGGDGQTVVVVGTRRRRAKGRS